MKRLSKKEAEAIFQGIESARAGGLFGRPKAARNSKLDARKAELERLEAKLWKQLEALARLVKRVKTAKRSIVALKRAARRKASKEAGK